MITPVDSFHGQSTLTYQGQKPKVLSGTGSNGTLQLQSTTFSSAANHVINSNITHQEGDSINTPAQTITAMTSLNKTNTFRNTLPSNLSSKNCITLAHVPNSDRQSFNLKKGATINYELSQNLALANAVASTMI